MLSQTESRCPTVSYLLCGFPVLIIDLTHLFALSANSYIDYTLNGISTKLVLYKMLGLSKTNLYNLFRVLVEQWIRAKYEREEFCHPERQNHYVSGFMEGFLMKRGKEDSRYHPRKFVLCEAEDTLKYHVKENKVI